MGYEVPIGVSNKHVHLTREAIDELFGKGYELHSVRPVKQPGQFAAEERVDVIGPKGTLKGLRVLGPAREYTQVELAMTDARTIGIDCPIRLSGHHEGTSGCTIVGPEGSITIGHGVIVALRHVHLNPEQAEESGFKDGEWATVRIEGERAITFDEVIVRTGPTHEAEFHIDTDEANAAGVSGGTAVVMKK